jgi:hypothetical protein
MVSEARSTEEPDKMPFAAVVVSPRAPVKAGSGFDVGEGPLTLQVGFDDVADAKGHDARVAHVVAEPLPELSVLLLVRTGTCISRGARAACTRAAPHRNHLRGVRVHQRVTRLIGITHHRDGQ